MRRPLEGAGGRSLLLGGFFLIGCFKSAAPPSQVEETTLSSASDVVVADRAPVATTQPQVEANESPTPTPIPTKESPFRLFLDEPYGYSVEHAGRRLYASERGVIDLTSGEVLFNCQMPRGTLMSGKTLFFAARMSPYSACPDSPFLLEQSGNAWKLRRYIDAHQLLMTEWNGGSIAAIAPYRSGPPWGYELVKVSGSAAVPRSMRAQSKSPDAAQYCHSELQYPIGLFAFASKTLYVVGDFRCDHLAASEEEFEDPEAAEKFEAEREVLQRELGRPAVEVFPKGRSPSRIITLPLDDVVSIEKAPGDALWILGKANSDSASDEASGAEDAPADHQVLVFFDGVRGAITSASVLGVRVLVAGPAPPPGETPATSGQEPNLPPAPHGLWLLDEVTLRRADGTDGALTLPAGCNPSDAWFIGEHAWVQCDSGLYSTDPGREKIVFEQTDASCDALDPRPTYSVAGLYQRASSAGGCGQRAPLPRSTYPGSKVGVEELSPPRGIPEFGY